MNYSIFFNNSTGVFKTLTVLSIIPGFFFSSEGLPSLTQEWPEHLASKVTDSEFQITDSDLPLGEGCSVVCKPLPSAPSLDTVSVKISDGLNFQKLLPLN